MGASQSKLPEPIIQEKLAVRLQALLVEDTQQELEKNYVHVDQEQKLSTSKYSPTVSIGAAELWEKELLEDPKVR
jgi:bleomycin hydrolase